MSEQTPMPNWVRQLYEELVSSVELEGEARLHARYTPQGAADRKTDLLEIFPVSTDDAKSRAKDTNRTKTFISYISINDVNSAFFYSDLAAFSYDGYGHPLIQYQGTVDDHEIVVTINIAPLDEATASEA